jgi:hypothetical protein
MLTRGLVPMLAALLLGLCVLLGVRAYQDWQRLHAPQATRVADTTRIRGWMTVRYIADAHRVPVAVLADRLGAPSDGRTTLIELARRRGVPPNEEVDLARQAVAELVQATPTAPGAGARSA